MRDFFPYNDLSYDAPRRPARNNTRTRRARGRRRRQEQIREERFLADLAWERELEFQLELEYERELQFEREAMIREELWREEQAYRAFVARANRPRRLRRNIPTPMRPYWRKSA